MVLTTKTLRFGQDRGQEQEGDSLLVTYTMLWLFPQDCKLVPVSQVANSANISRNLHWTFLEVR